MTATDGAAGVRRILRRAFDEYLDGLTKAVAGLSPDERRFRPGEDANHIDFLVWHLARNEDGTISACARAEELWTSAGWHERWALPADGDGCGWTDAEVAAFPPIATDELAQYFDDVRRRTLTFLDGLTLDLLDEPMSEHHPDVSVGQVLSHLVVEQSQHLGQVALIRGLLRGQEHTTSWNNPETPRPG